MMPPADRIRGQKELDPGRVTHTRQEVGSNDFLAILHVQQRPFLEFYLQHGGENQLA